MKKIILSLILFAGIFLSNVTAKDIQLKVFQINTWHEGTSVKGGFDAIVDEIIHQDADIVLFSEIRNYNNTDYIARTLSALKEKGKTYYGNNDRSVDVGIISKYPIQKQAIIGRDINPGVGILKARINIANRELVIYSAHLDYKNYACYLPRGYSGVTWKKIDAPITDPDSVVSANRLSLRDEGITAFIADAKKEPAGITVILGGDFNEPSHLDWTEATKNLYDHNGAVIKWDCSSLLYQNGFIDSFRKKYPNPVTHPGFTFPADNKDVDVSKLAWAADADERDRIDFVYYLPNNYIRLKDVSVVGPQGDIIKGKRVISNSKDRFVLPKGVWPTDHKAMLATFSIHTSSK